MRRIHAFEFTDLSWWPNTFRTYLTDFLRTLLVIFKPFKSKMVEIDNAIKNSNNKSIVDLCSGTSGPWVETYKELCCEQNANVKVYLTDKFPIQNVQFVSSINENIIKVFEPIDATMVPKDFKGVRTLFNGFHHFSEDCAKAILRDAIKNDEPIFIFELLQRSKFDVFFLSFTTPFFVWFITPFVRPFRWSRLFWTYIIPLAPLIITWDTLISNLRCYTKEELLNMAKEVDCNNQFEWFSGQYRKGLAPVTYLFSKKINSTEIK